MHPTAELRRPEGLRTDVQALRAFAVLAVVLFHIWPNALPGGYIGVDVFFVISGFLITGQLVRLRERDALRLGAFWAGRARRLLPASLLVLLVSVAAAVLWAPPTLLGAHLRSIIASALYVVNWQLAADGVDYLAHSEPPPIAQHYWSLAAEEQFYLLWPLLLLLATAGAARSPLAKRRTLLVGVLIVLAAGFAVSVWLTQTSYPYGYFSTVSRLWEFALGAAVALAPLPALPPTARTAVWVAAVATLAATTVLYTAATPFPGPAALVPTAAAAAIIALGPAAPSPVLDRVVGARPVQWVGDQSYGIYLWHWPLIVIAPAVLGRPTDLGENVLILVATIVLAALAKRFVEDPIRFGRPVMTLRPGRILLATATAMAVVVGAASVPLWQSASAAAQQAHAVAEDLQDPSSCRGAHALLVDGCPDDVVAASDVVPALSALHDDTGGAFSCYDAQPTAGGDPRTCTLGSDDPGALRLALTGDSHAAMLLPGLREEATARGWRIDSFVGRGCVWQRPALPGCEQYNALVEDRLRSGDYDAIVVTAMNALDRDAVERTRVGEAYAAAWQDARDAGLPVVVLADNPAVPAGAQECVAEATSFSRETCAFDVTDAGLDVDPLRQAAALAQTPLIDLSAAYCADGVCPMQLGGVLVYRDRHHITATFSQTLAPSLADQIEDALATR